MREVDVSEIISAVEALFVDANICLPDRMREAMAGAIDREESPVGREVLGELLKNADIARDERLPICQDTGVAVTFVEIGQDVHVVGGSFEEAIAEGVRRGYRKGFLRKSLCHPFSRKNTGDNTPPILHTRIVPGDKIRIVAMPKGGGSENYGEVRMLVPAQGKDGVKSFVLEMVNKGGPNPCPPVIIGVGIGGNLEMSALLSKEALMVPVGERNADPEMGELEMELLKEINRTGIGPQGYGGTITALDVHIKMMPCHLASLPVAVNIQCHAHRIKEALL